MHMQKLLVVAEFASDFCVGVACNPLASAWSLDRLARHLRGRARWREGVITSRMTLLLVLVAAVVVAVVLVVLAVVVLVVVVGGLTTTTTTSALAARGQSSVICEPEFCSGHSRQDHMAVSTGVGLDLNAPVCQGVGL